MQQSPAFFCIQKRQVRNVADVIDDLKIQIEASTQSADAKLDKFIAKMVKLQSTITGIEMSNVGQIASGINQIAASVQGFNERTKKADFNRIAVGMSKIAGVDAAGVSNTAKAMATFVTSMCGASQISFDVSEMTSIADAVAKFGRVSVTSASSNLQTLKNDLKEFVAGMNRVGTLTFNPDSLIKVVSSISKLGGTNVTQSVKNLPQITKYLSEFVTGINAIGGVTFGFSGLESLVNSISRLGGVKATQAAANLKPIKEQILRFVSGLNGIGALNFDTTNLTNLVSSISRLGGKAAGNAIGNIQQLGVALKGMMQTLSTAPAVSQNLIQMTNALAALASNGSRVSTASNAMYKGLNLYSSGAKKATSHSFSLAAAIGKVYATYWMLFRALGLVRKAINISSDLTEVQNVIDVSFGNMAGMVDKFTGNSIQKFGMSELAAKKMAGVYMAMGRSLGAPQKEMADMSIELTKLAADMSSFYNVSQEDVGEDLRSVFTGMVRPLRDYGIDLTQANLQQYALAQGIQKPVAAMSQLEKVQLRYNYVMQQTAGIQGDYQRTAGTWANQVRLLCQQFQQLGAIVGGTLINAFKPFLTAMNAVISKVIAVAKAISDALGKIFGWTFEASGGGAGTAGIVGDLEDAAGAVDDLGGGAGGAADKLGDAAKNAKKLAGNLQAFDKLNVITSPNDSGGSGGSGGGGGAGGGAGAGNYGEWVQGESILDHYKSDIDNLFELGEYIGETLTSAMNNIDWDRIYERARGFGSGLANFLNGLISPELFDATGRTIAGALNTSLHFLDSFGTTFDWKDFGNSIAAGINGFFGKFDFSLAAQTINTWANGMLDTIIIALDKTHWDSIGTKIGSFLEEIEFTEIGSKLGEAIWKAINAGIEVWKGSFKAAPIETTIISAVGLLKFTGLGKILGVRMMASIAKGFSKGLSFAGIGKILAKAFPGNVVVSTITTTMAQTGASLPAILSGLILTPIKTFFTVTIPGAIGSLASGIGSILGMKGAAAIATGGGVLIAAAAAAVAGVVYTVTHWDEVKAFWGDTVPNWWSNTVIPFFQDIPKNLGVIWEKVKTVASEKWNTFLDFMGGIPERIGETVNSIGEWFNQLPGKIGHALGYALGTVTKWGIDVASYLAKEIPQITSNVGTWFLDMKDKIWNSIVLFVTNTLPHWKDTVKAFFSEKIPEIINDVKEKFMDFKEKAGEAISLFVSETLPKWKDNTINFFTEKIPDIIEKAVEAFGKLKDKLFTVGEDAIRGLWNGISNLTDWLGTNIANFCKGVIDGFKAGFDEHSPSKEAFQIGDYFTLGLGNGIVNRFKDIYADISDFTDKLTGFNISPPWIDPNIEINRSLIDTIETRQMVSFDSGRYDFKADISGELSAALSGIIDYEKLGEEVYKAQSRAMQENPTKIGDSDVFNAVRNEDRRRYKQTGRPSWAGI